MSEPIQLPPREAIPTTPDLRRLVRELRDANLVLSRRVAELDALHHVSSVLSTKADLSELLDTILHSASVVIGAAHGSIMLLDETRGVLTVMAVCGSSRQQYENTHLPLGESIAGWVAAHGEPLLIENVEDDARFARRNRPQFESKSLVCAPLRTPGGVLGVISLSDKTGADKFIAEDLRLLVTLAAQAAIAIEDSQRFQQVRRQLLETTTLHELSQQLSEVERTGQMVQAVFACIDRLVTCESLQWWQWDAGSQALRLEADTAETTGQRADNVVVAVVDPGSALSGPRGYESQLRAVLERSGRVPGEILAVPVRSADHPLGVFAVTREAGKPFDDAERRLAEFIGAQAERIFDRQRALWNASRLVTMGKMISEISHDLRKPLTNIRGSLQVMRGRLMSDPQTSSVLESTEQEVVRLAALVTELVDFSNPTKYKTERRDIRPMIMRAVGLIGQTAKKHNIAVNVNILSALKPVFCDENQITEALLNVLMNAIEAMPSGGSLDVTACAEPLFPSAQEQIHLAIKDTGAGMSPTELARCFERYHTTKPTGTGLGLAIVQRIVQAHDGEIWAESAPQVGTTFHIRLPVR